MRTRIYFVRHAEAQSNANPDFDASKGALDNLTEKGQSQAVQLALRFQHIPVEAIYSSAILRAELTAKEIGIVTGLEPKILPYIKEIKGSFPDKFLFKNVPEDVMIEEVRKIVHHPIWLPEMDETFNSFKSRIVELKNFLESLEYKHVVVVSHARFIKAFASYIMLGELLTEELSAEISLRLTVGNTAVSKFEYNHDKAKWRIENWNDEVHLG
jgi:probable phosphoglycerate mutase